MNYTEATRLSRQMSGGMTKTALEGLPPTWLSATGDGLLAYAMEQQDRADYEKKRREAAERRAKINHYGLVAGGALAGGTGAGLLSYLLAPRMSGLVRALTMVGGAAAGGAAAHYGSELVNDRLASR